MRQKDIQAALEVFGRTVRDVRKSRNLTQEKLGEICERHSVYISELERGIKSPSLDTILKICDALKITPGDLMNMAFGTEDQELRNRIIMACSRQKGRELEQILRIVEAYSGHNTEI